MLYPALKEKSQPEIRQAFLNSLRPGQLVEALFDAVPEAFYFVKDAECRFVGASLDFAKTLGQTSVEALIGKTDYDFSPDFLADAFYRDDRFVLENGQAIYDKIELVPSADGSLDWLCTTKIPLFDTDGKIVGLAGVTRIIRDTDSVYADHPEMHRIVAYVRANYREKLTTTDMAKIGGISVSSQERLFRKTFGLTPLMYLRKTRLNAACKLLRETNTLLADIAVECGFNDQTNMTRAFRMELKITPLRYRRRFSERPQLKANRRKLEPQLT
ncbi:MAG: AraC family transcriptional regulator [Verrucomicrobiota bacterium]